MGETVRTPFSTNPFRRIVRETDRARPANFGLVNFGLVNFAIQRRLEKWILLIRSWLGRFLIGSLCRLEMQDGDRSGEAKTDPSTPVELIPQARGGGLSRHRSEYMPPAGKRRGLRRIKERSGRRFARLWSCRS